MNRINVWQCDAKGYGPEITEMFEWCDRNCKEDEWEFYITGILFGRGSEVIITNREGIEKSKDDVFEISFYFRNQEDKVHFDFRWDRY